MELWGGVECTVNRVHDVFRDQLRMSGHHDRPGDLELFADLGLTRLRYPVLWERVAPDRPDERDWSWSDDRLARIRALGMQPIVGLVHHGSGPRYTSLVTGDFAPLLGDYAAAVAQRYPDLLDWTPVNEPLTTARFSALYGHWYPHARDEALFWRALLNQVDGTRAAMRAIRRVNPAARLIQTEDLGRCYATPALAGIADHYNSRRWMTWDLLTGSVGPTHSLWPRLARFGLGDRLRAIADDPCPPDLLGVNHYITSDRFLDDRATGHGPLPSDGFHDLAAARALDPAPAGLTGAVREAWERYRIPIAITECHLGCTREDQVRWLGQGWRDCLALAGEGVDVRALTAWALLGSFDWNSLLTRDAGHYESGAFDVRGDQPRLTTVGRLAATLGRSAPPAPTDAALLAVPGWWQRDMRLEHPAFAWPGPAAAMPHHNAAAPLLIAGASGSLGRMLARACRARGLDHVLLDRAALPLRDANAMDAALDRHQPCAVINAAGWVRVDEAEEQVDACHAVNAAGAGVLARTCAACGLHCTLFPPIWCSAARRGLMPKRIRPRRWAPMAAARRQPSARRRLVTARCW